MSAQTSSFIIGNIVDVVTCPLTRWNDARGWLVELFRQDELAPEFLPQMSYISLTHPGVTRGPHEHIDQADYFCFFGPGNFRLDLWDNRPTSNTYHYHQTLIAGMDSPLSVLIPAGIVHAYTNISNEPGLVINCPNRLYKGPGRQEAVDEIRHEDDPATIFRITLPQ
jgi:dTDP-4-dehydrorhamnose 3,5-epimerase